MPSQSHTLKTQCPPGTFTPPKRSEGLHAKRNLVLHFLLRSFRHQPLQESSATHVLPSVRPVLPVQYPQCANTITIAGSPKASCPRAPWSSNPIITRCDRKDCQMENTSIEDN